MKKGFDPQRLDVRRFAEEAAELSSEAPLSSFARLMTETAGRGGQEPVRWTVRGELLNPGHVRPQVWMHLDASTRLVLTCQRCLQPLEADVQVDRSFRFVPDEATAATEDEDAEEDVLAESRAFDLPALVEDEILMEMPLAPRHVICPVTLPASAGDAEFEAAQARKDNPFEVLAGLAARKRH